MTGRNDRIRYDRGKCPEMSLAAIRMSRISRQTRVVAGK
jgi:hypothetical protein